MKVITTRSLLPKRALSAFRKDVRAKTPGVRTKVTVEKVHGWNPAPTLIDVWTATCAITAKGFRTKRGILWVMPDGRWRFA
jgi:hypothetical protein